MRRSWRKKTSGLLGLLFLLAWSLSAHAATRLAFQDFETTGWETQFTGAPTWPGHVARTASNPARGRFSLRGNQQLGTVDAITGLTGLGNALLDWRGNGQLARDTPEEMYFSYWFRHDDYNWNDSGDGKLFYFVDAQYSIRAMYFARQLQEGRNSLRITYQNGGYSDAWARAAANWGGMSLYLAHPEVSGSMGEWKHFEYYINYAEHYFMVWVNGHLLTPTNGRYADGRISYDPGLDIHWNGIQLFYASSSVDTANASDGASGYAAGWQIDDLEFWDGLPSEAPVDPPEPGAAGSLAFSRQEYTAQRSQGYAYLPIIRLGGSTGEVSVEWTSSGGSARHGVDYYGADNQPVYFADGETSKRIAIELIDNGAEEDRSFSVSLANAGGGVVLGDFSQVTVTIPGGSAMPPPVMMPPQTVGQ